MKSGAYSFHEDEVELDVGNPLGQVSSPYSQDLLYSLIDSFSG